MPSMRLSLHKGYVLSSPLSPVSRLTSPVLAALRPTPTHLHPSIMKFASVLTALMAVPVALGATVSVSFDQFFDNPANSLATVACSDGTNGLLTKGPCRCSSPPIALITH